MTNFNNPNEMPQEMLFFSFEEFKQFLSVEDDLKFKCIFMILYYCGLRIGELKGITWKDINFENKTISINKQITQQCTRDNWHFVPPKTKKSNRVLPLNKTLLESLKMLKKEDKELLIGFNDKFFFDKGVLFSLLYPKTCKLGALVYCIKKRKKFKEYGFLNAYRQMKKGIRFRKREL